MLSLATRSVATASTSSSAVRSFGTLGNRLCAPSARLVGQQQQPTASSSSVAKNHQRANAKLMTAASSPAAANTITASRFFAAVSESAPGINEPLTGEPDYSAKAKQLADAKALAGLA